MSIETFEKGSQTEQIILLGLRDYCHGIPSKECSLDVKTLLNLSRKHSLVSIIYHQFAENNPQLKKTLEVKKAVLANHIYFMELGKRFKRVSELLSTANIDFVCFKGSVFRDYYRFPVHRSMGDVDILIHPQDREKVKDLFLTNLKWKIHVDNHDVWSYIDEPYTFEIHTRMFFDPLSNDFDYCSYFDQIWNHIHRAPVFGIDSDNQYVPDESFHLLYLMAHTAKHITNSGSGFRAYLDMVMMCKACEDKLDWHYITAELEKMQLLDFTKICFSLCKRWFNVDMPLKNDSLEESFFDYVTEKTFTDGVFGLDNRQNTAAHAAREIKRAQEKGTSYRIGSLELIIRKLFPPYKDMQLVPWYKFVDGKPWLLPAAWIYRCAYCLVRKRSQAKILLTQPFIQKQNIQERERLLKSWGL